MDSKTSFFADAGPMVATILVRLFDTFILIFLGFMASLRYSVQITPCKIMPLK